MTVSCPAEGPTMTGPETTDDIFGLIDKDITNALWVWGEPLQAQLPLSIIVY